MAGVAAGNPAGTVLGRGLTVLLIAYAVGRLLGVASTAVLATGEAAGPAAASSEADAGPRTLPFDPAEAGPDGASNPSPARTARRAA